MRHDLRSGSEQHFEQINRRQEESTVSMDESKKFILINIAYYQRLLATETDPKEREAIAQLLAEEQAKLREKERKERDT
jgi:hypothetical protein